MKRIEETFKKNANFTGIMTFQLVDRHNNPDGTSFYIYKRIKKDGSIFNYEVFRSTVKKAGTYPLPNGSTITYEEDIEQYPGASQFGIRAWEAGNLATAKHRFQQLVNGSSVIVEDDSSGEDDEETKSPSLFSSPPEESSGRRGRPKKERNYNLPEVEFSVEELATFNGVPYIDAYLFLKVQLEAGNAKFVRSERRNEKGKPTKIYSVVKKS